MKFLGKLLVTISFMSVGTMAYPKSNMIFERDEYPQAWCLAQNIYYEARGSSKVDQIAVADVVLNRVQSDRYPDTICGVVQDGYRPGRNVCQFSWYCDGKSDLPENQEAWIKAQQIAINMVYNDKYVGITEGATHYHASYVLPEWAETKTQVVQIGEHIFYRWENEND